MASFEEMINHPRKSKQQLNTTKCEVHSKDTRKKIFKMDKSFLWGEVLPELNKYFKISSKLLGRKFNIEHKLFSTIRKGIYMCECFYQNTWKSFLLLTITFYWVYKLCLCSHQHQSDEKMYFLVVRWEKNDKAHILPSTIELTFIHHQIHHNSP